MDALFLSRLQFALTIGFHYIFPAITIGMAWVIVWMQTKYLRSGDEADHQMAGFWIRVFALTFAFGVATGIVMEFQFGMNWARYSRFVGDIFGAPLAAEGIFAFFLESSFLGILLFGENRVSKRIYWFSALMVAVGSSLSGLWIIAANSWQQTPAGYELVNGRAELTDFWAAVFNPSTVPRYFHTIDGALIAGSFFIMGLSAWMLLKGIHMEMAKRSLRISLVFAFVSSVLMIPLGHHHAIQVARTQPTKMAAFEGLWETQSNAPLLLFGWPNVEREETDFAIEVPGALSLGIHGDVNAQVEGIKETPVELRPPILLTFSSFHTMFGLGVLFMMLTGLGVLLLWRKRLHCARWFLWLCVLFIPLPVVANEFGWMAAEVGRQPWIVQGLLLTADAHSETVPAEQILASIVLFSIVYALLFILWVFLLRKKIRKGPAILQVKP